MGVKLGELVKHQEVNLKELSGKVIAIDASLFIYQFITTILQPDGKPLSDSKGRITSHLSGLFSRNMNLIEKGLKLVYVFDGKPPELKSREAKRRSDLKDKALEQYSLALERKDIDSMKKYSSRTVKFTPEMADEAKELLDAMGIPVVQAPSEAEAQGSYMVSRGDCYAIATQDSDSFMFGATRIVRNLSLLGRRKKSSSLSYTQVRPELILLSDMLNDLGIDQDQFIAMCMLIGTDYNIGGIKGLGPKKALSLVKEFGKDFDRMFMESDWNGHFDYPWTDVYYQIKKIAVTSDYSLSWRAIDRDRVLEILVDRHDFMRERIEGALGKVAFEKTKKDQKSLFDF